MTKILIASIIIVSAMIYGIIWLDTKEDKENLLIIKKDSIIFDNWECGYQCNTPKFKVFKGENYNVLRIRYGKDFIALKIESKNGLFGWAILDKNFEKVKNEKTLDL